MLTDQDIQKLKETFATRDELLELFPTKEEVTTKDDFDDLRKDFSNLQISVDGYAKKADTYFQEMAALAHKVNRHGEWLKQIAEKVGMKLEY